MVNDIHMVLDLVVQYMVARDICQQFLKYKLRYDGMYVKFNNKVHSCALNVSGTVKLSS